MEDFRLPGLRMTGMDIQGNYSGSIGILACAPPSGERQRDANFALRPKQLLFRNSHAEARRARRRKYPLNTGDFFLPAVMRIAGDEEQSLPIFQKPGKLSLSENRTYQHRLGTAARAGS